MLLVDAFEEFMLDQKVRGNSVHTLDYYRRTLNHFKACTSVVECSDVSLDVCRSFSLYLSDELRLSSVSIQSYVRGFRAFLSWCFNAGYITQDLSRSYKLPKAQRKTINVLTDAELTRLISCFDQSKRTQLRDLCICGLMFDSGLRLEEATSILTANVHLDEGYLIVNGKGNKERIVPLGKNIRKYIRTYIDPATVYLFTHSDGTSISRDTVKDLFRRLKKRAKISRLHPHLLRHTFATRYLENGGDIYSLQAILGHTSLTMVQKYLHLSTVRRLKMFSRHSPFDNLSDERHHDYLVL